MVIQEAVAYKLQGNGWKQFKNKLNKLIKLLLCKQFFELNTAIMNLVKNTLFYSKTS